MSRTLFITAPLLGLLLAACSVLNRADPVQPPQMRSCDAGTCNEVDPCAACDEVASCEAFDGGARCVCPETRVDVDGDGSHCAEKGECSANVDCGNQGVCSAVDGERVCGCRPGFSREDGRCVDVDECAGGSHDCDPHARCTNESGGFTCTCREGYEDVDGDGRSCRDIDECDNGSARCGENAVCENSKGAYGCSCIAGYEGNPRVRCDDTDECAHGLLECALPATCSDQPGPDRCTCPSYYSDANGDGTVCADDRAVMSMAVRAPPFSTYIATPYEVDDGPLSLVMGGFFIGETTPCDEPLTADDFYFDIFLAGFDRADGCWARSFGSSGSDQLFDIAVGRDGGPLTMVFLDDEISLDGEPLPGPACMLLKFDAEGALDWNLRLPGCEESVGIQALVRGPAPDALDVDEAGNFYAYWPYSAAATIGTRAVPAPEAPGAMLIKVSPSGKPIWVATFSPDVPGYPVVADRFAVAADGRVYVGGIAYGNFTPPGDHTRHGPARFLAALHPDGTTRWVKLYEPDEVRIADVAAHAGGVSVLRTSNVSGLVRVSLHSFDLEGHDVWQTQLGEGAIDLMTEVEASRDGGMIAVGQVDEPATIGGEAAAHAMQLFLTHIDADGSITWSHIYDQEQVLSVNTARQSWDIAFGPDGLFYIAVEGLYIEHPDWTSLTAFRP